MNLQSSSFCKNIDAAFAGLFSVMLFVSSAHATSHEMRLDFETATVGAPPQGFTSGLTGKGKPVAWIVLEDPTAPAGPKVLAETSGDTTGNRFPLSILDGVEAKDVDVRVHFSAISGTVDQAAGLMVRVQDEGNYYVARANALEDNVRLYRVVDGDRQQLVGADVEVLAGEWQELGLRIEGNHLTVSFEGRDLLSTTDLTFPNAGRVGLWTKADSLTHFDELVVRRLP